MPKKLRWTERAMEEFGLMLDHAVNAACNACDAITSVDPEHMEQVFQEMCRKEVAVQQAEAVD